MTKPSFRGNTFVGILIGFVLGLATALAVAWYINKLPNPFRDKPQTPQTPEPVKPPATKPVPAENAKDASGKADGKSDGKDAKDEKKDKADKKDKSDKSDEGADKKASGKEVFFIQTGAFQNQADADNLKARIALLGLEASVQARNIPDKGAWYRVRLGPYSSIDELNTIRGALTQNSIETVMVRVREAEKQ